VHDAAMSDSRSSISLAEHPGSTASDVARGINANRNTVATRLSRLAKAGEITKAEKGYTVKS
jgi:DNA-binding IclR family transcriptional regulator